MKKFVLLLTAIVSFFNSVKSEIMERSTINKMKALSFDSYDDDIFDEQDFDSDSQLMDEFEGTRKGLAKRSLIPSARGFKPNSGTFTITIANGHTATAQVELFNSLKSVAHVQNTSLFSGYSPFTAINRNAANLNDTIHFDGAGNLLIQNTAGEICTISCKQIPYAVLMNTLMFYRVKFKNFRLTYVNDSTLDNDIRYFQSTFLGMKNENSLTPRTYFADNQFQGKQVTITEELVIDGERGLSFNVNASETISLNFNLQGVQKF